MKIGAVDGATPSWQCVNIQWSMSSHRFQAGSPVPRIPTPSAMKARSCSETNHSPFSDTSGWYELRSMLVVDSSPLTWVPLLQGLAVWRMLKVGL